MIFKLLFTYEMTNCNYVCVGEYILVNIICLMLICKCNIACLNLGYELKHAKIITLYNYMT